MSSKYQKFGDYLQARTEAEKSSVALNVPVTVWWKAEENGMITYTIGLSSSGIPENKMVDVLEVWPDGTNKFPSLFSADAAKRKSIPIEPLKSSGSYRTEGEHFMSELRLCAEDIVATHLLEHYRKEDLGIMAAALGSYIRDVMVDPGTCTFEDWSSNDAAGTVLRMWDKDFVQSIRTGDENGKS